MTKVNENNGNYLNTSLALGEHWQFYTRNGIAKAKEMNLEQEKEKEREMFIEDLRISSIEIDCE